MSTHAVKIAARLRPRINGEVDDDSIKVHTTPSTSLSDPSSSGSSSTSFISVTNPRDPSQVFKFPFTSCYDQSSTQEEIFNNDVQPMIDVVYSGVTVTIFAYGVTSSGKTHTMQGTKTDPGVIPRVVRSMFMKQSHLRRYVVNLSVSYMEIYKDEVYDLLVTRDNAPKLPVRENDHGKVFVANLSSIPISSVEEFDTIYAQATKHRSVGSTNLNHASSRSHAVLTIEVSMTDPVKDITLTGKINLVDLAGSENNRLTGNDPSRMAESAAINKSLSVLGQVVHALNQGASRIPYRNSKLTRILQDALGGSSVGLLICNLAPGVKFRQDTLNTLNFAVRTKNVENKPVVNERDNRVQPKPHFAAIQPPPPKLAPAVLQQTSILGGHSRPSVGGIPRAGPSRVPRVSTYGAGAGGSGYQPFAMGGGGKRMSFAPMGMGADEKTNSLTMGMTDKEIDERIAKAVEAEVARRLEEREKERERENEERRAKEQHEQQAEAAERQADEQSKQTLPSGVLTPLLKRHRDLDDELKARLYELEAKFERGNKETQLADVLSPVSKKKTGRAYVALARAHSEKGDLQVALDLYRKAESYVPDNVKLKERIIEIEWSVKHNTEFVPSPKKPKKAKSKKKGKSFGSGLKVEPVEGTVDFPMDVDEETQRPQDEKANMGKRKKSARFGSEATNRPEEKGNEDAESPLKRQRLISGKDWAPAGKMSKRQAMEGAAE
ncbi:hypothetical protein PILCRDRAFT_137751 [Piloderma croceum F 1598]|uniref:Kinesin-like protein n=1 Tax=Piloderma croceum (strain F 1598) TaxID=765440 RepID=A0A0C3GMH6_PILCF|nr:hypothetical protein PILCRDRAFT_137751 [Piloderma croceum F 1598]